MAKRCIDKITVDGADYSLMQLNDFSIFNSYTGWDIDCSNAGYSYISSYGYDIMAIGGDRWISSGYKDWDIINSNDGAVRIQNNNWNSVAKNIIFDKSDSNCRTRNSYNSSNQNLNMWCAIIVDDETELGFAIIVRQFPNGGTKDAWIYNDSNNDYAYCKKIYQCFGNVAQKITSNGGGATHIAKVTGQLKDLSSNLSDILMVSGGGGGGYLVGDTDYSGKEAGGISGSGDNSADQSTGNAFGQGESGTNLSGGGSGLYGGYKGTSSKSGGAGSGYIGNSLLSNKKMVGYNVPTSDAESTKTESVSTYSTNYVANQPKAGNGHARIKFLRSARELYVDDIQFINGNPTSYDDKNSNWLKGANIFFTYTGGGYSPANTLIPLGNGTKVNPNYNQFNYDSERYNPWLAQTNCCVNVVDVNIDSLNLTISYGEHYPFIFEDVRNSAYPAARFSGAIVGQAGYSSEMSAWDCQGQFLSGMDWSSLPTSGFADLDAIFKFLRQRFKNINIYVDGEAWSLPSGDVTLEHFDSIAKNLDFSHNKDYRNTQGYPSGEATTIDDVPSEYYGTDWMLVVGQMNMEVPTYSDGVISLAKGSSALFCTGVVYIPITRKTVKTLYLKLTISDGYRVGIGVAKIVNNVVTSTELYYNTSTGSDISLSLDVNDVVDYLMFSFGQQAVTISDIVFACE